MFFSKHTSGGFSARRFGSRNALQIWLALFLAAAIGGTAVNASAQEAGSAGAGPATSSVIIYSQPMAATGGLFQSSWWDPDGSDWDQYVWDSFTLQANQTIAEIHWRGGYDPAKFGSGGQALDFKIRFYLSRAAGAQPDVINLPLVEYQTGSNAGQTPAGTFGGAAMYDYSFSLPVPFQAAAGTKYWVQIEAAQHGIPDWGIAAGAGGDGTYFRRIDSQGLFYQTVPGDAAFSLWGPALISYPVYLPLVRQ